MRNLLCFKDRIASFSSRRIPILSLIYAEYISISPNLGRRLHTINCFNGDPFGQLQCAVVKSPKAAESTLAHINNFLRGVTSSMLTQNLGFGSKISYLLPLSSGRETGIAIACDIFKALVLSAKSLSSTCYMRFATCFTSFHDCAHLLNTVRNIERELPNSQGRVVMNRILLAFGESRQTEAAISLFSWMKKSTVGPDLVTYNIFLDAMGRTGKVNEVMIEFESMGSYGLSPDFISFNTVLNAYRKAGRLDLCLKYQSKMVKRGIQPDLLTFTALIASLGRSGNVEEALRLFDDLKAMEIPPSLYVYRSLIADTRKMGRIHLASAMQCQLNTNRLNLARPTDFKRNSL